MANKHLERAKRYDASADFVVPTLDALVGSGGRVEGSTIRLTSEYFDTEHLDLLTHGVTLRRRTAAADADADWRLEVAAGIDRTETRLPLTAREGVPPDLAALVIGVRRGSALRSVVTVSIARTVQRLLGPDGRVIVEVADDRVQAAVPRRGAGTLSEWREIEVEIGPAGLEEVLTEIDNRLRGAGAEPSPSSTKVARALGVVTPGGVAVSANKTAGDLIRSYVKEQDDALIAGDLMLRSGLGGIHSTRVATRRLRSTLRIFSDYFDVGQAAAFDRELSWYAALLGEVRDREVQRARFAEMIAELPPEQVLGPVAARIEQSLLTEQIKHRNALDKAMDNRRYLTLLRYCAVWAAHPPFTRNADEDASGLRAYVRASGRTVRKHLAVGLGKHGGDEQLHKARKAAKRGRYTAELTRSVLGKKSRKSIKRYGELQDILGDHQDGVVAADLLRRLAVATLDRAGESAFTYGVLYAEELQRAERSRRRAEKWSAKPSR